MATTRRATAAKPAPTAKGGATPKTVDMTNVKEVGQFNPRRKKAGDYRAKVTKVEDHRSNAGNDQWVFTITIPGDARASYPYYCGFDDKQAWKIRNLIIATGKEVPKKRLKINPNNIVGAEIGITLEDDEYEGKPKSVVQATFPVSELDSDSPDDENDDSNDDDTVDDDDEIDDDDIEEVDLDEL